MHSLMDVATAVVMPTITGKEAAMLILRWFHFLAGITWVGLLYFFNLVNVPFMKTVDAPAKPNVFQNLTLPALNWFRWSSVVTVLVGVWFFAAQGMFFWLIFRFGARPGVPALYVTGTEKHLKRWINIPHVLVILCDVVIFSRVSA